MSDARAIEAAAATWLMRREEAAWSETDEAVFQAWLDASMAHKAAFWRLEYAWGEADRIGALGPAALGRSARGEGHAGAGRGADAGVNDAGAGDPRADDPCADDAGTDDRAADDPPRAADPGAGRGASEGASDAAAAPGSNIIAFPARARRWPDALTGGARRRGTAALVALALVTGAAALSWSGVLPARKGGEAPPLVAAAPPLGTAELATAVGGRKIVRLRDGSRIELNTATRIRASVAGPAREVWLEDGEAYFEVKHAAGQPFIVHAGSHTVTVLGTKFTVVRDGEDVKVSVIEGRVRVDDARAGAPLRSNVITGGDIMLVRGADTLLSEGQAAEVERDLAWRGGMISFRQSTLGAAAAEFNRYNKVKLEIADPATASIRIGGTFKASNVAAFARLLEDAYGLKVETRDERIIISD